MGSYSKYLSIALLTLFACQETPEPLPEVNQTDTETKRLLVDTWVYESVVARGTTFILANSRMELGNNRNRLGANRADLIRRKIEYRADGTYQLQWSERGDYSLGTVGDENWQPNFGYWTLNGNQLVHNPGQTYETTYLVSISETRFSRTTDRYMSEANQGAGWSPGEVVTQIENFNREAE